MEQNNSECKQKKLSKEEFVQVVIAAQERSKKQKLRLENQLKSDSFGMNLRRCKQMSRCWSRSYNKTYARYTSC